MTEARTRRRAASDSSVMPLPPPRVNRGAGATDDVSEAASSTSAGADGGGGGAAATTTRPVSSRDTRDARIGSIDFRTDSWVSHNRFCDANSSSSNLTRSRRFHTAAFQCFRFSVARAPFERRLARREDVLGVEQILGRELARAQGFHFELTRSDS